MVKIAVDADTVEADGYFSALQQVLVARLQQEQGDEEDDRYPSGLAILYEQRLDISYEVEAAVAKIGLCVIIMTPAAVDKSPGIPIPRLDDITIIAQIVENPIINRDEGNPDALNIPAGRLAWLVAEDFKRTIVDSSQISLAGFRQIVNEEQGLVMWNVTNKLSY